MLKVNVNNKKEFEIEFNSNGLTSGKINNQKFEWDIYEDSAGCMSILRNNQSYNASILEADIEKKEFVINVKGNAYKIKVKDHYDELLKNLGLENAFVQKINEIKAPMPGLVIDILVNEGDEIKKGDSVFVLEAMKMENVIKSPTDGIIKEIFAEKGKAVEKNFRLVSFE